MSKLRDTDSANATKVKDITTSSHDHHHHQQQQQQQHQRQHHQQQQQQQQHWIPNHHIITSLPPPPTSQHHYTSPHHHIITTTPNITTSPHHHISSTTTNITTSLNHQQLLRSGDAWRLGIARNPLFSRMKSVRAAMWGSLSVRRIQLRSSVLGRVLHCKIEVRVAASCLCLQSWLMHLHCDLQGRDCTSQGKLLRQGDAWRLGTARNPVLSRIKCVPASMWWTLSPP